MRHHARRWLALVCFLALAACAVPHHRDGARIEKTAAREAEVTKVFDRYREVRNTAIELLDAKPLSTVETGPVLAIDTGSFEVSQRLATKQAADTSAVEVTQVLTPRFSAYPLWFFAVVRERDAGVNRVQIFERGSSVDPWLLSASPETLARTKLPDIRQRSGAPVTVKPQDGAGMSMSAQDAAAAYAKVLADPQAPEARRIASDSFIKQMRSTAATNGSLRGVKFSQTWAADDVRYALRTTDGGALAFVTLLRSDTYDVEDGLTITWPEGTPQQAFLASGIAGSGKLNYYHQVLLYLPGGGGKPRALGQYGGVVSADASTTASP
ncbi:hypothetical protein [Aeromicrobium chenweiae]|uniref:DUF8094 domain-containing protein n=1 Tax=Aeromicrobium chenweiae TaxID=2079793 RepID=A0A2S0WNN4_9ACTN|nr:hypothetical protein [Aeromicrobium chenweiae]AWB92927.1 hypothetical protein C3E78_12330 [Aeromicrobium chenweiae]TGN33922.1 hypothetical protein E4L97_02380 [Aeromicrobium chenweiae]